MNRLTELGLELSDHPFDYQIVREGDYYHDPAIADEKITWQYAVAGKDVEFPEDIRCEILDRCYIPESDATRAPDIDWDAVERESFRLTGNEDTALTLLLVSQMAADVLAGTIAMILARRLTRRFPADGVSETFGRRRRLFD